MRGEIFLKDQIFLRYVATIRRPHVNKVPADADAYL